ncbi:DNA polymerase III, alpha subunit [Leadbetterella byssophila DSM 17132]|uniref:DNA-directed DNA polymerase n=1 Tax=Leadbetterella byssophila (strain DSM 17132 / JCM 16389 / KACC 11308 / NBRC 106382 / 4M15) TaxID=649349 RepID=E4RY15_LEAB4|nr:DNA polymerase III subunit alpha [Leadbetterella byssophila]ADQ16343.1 DNA polymerase III, alpha subunit [Leadbetterella byssophila DSM 17132]
MYLNCHSYHSLRYGTIPLEELVAEAKRCGVKTLALTDINTVTGIYDFEKACKDAGIKPVVGMEVRKEDQLLYIALAQNAQGIKEICTLLTEHNCEGTPLLPIAPEFKHLFTVYPLENCPPTLRNREYLGIRPDEIHSLIRPELRAYLDRMVVLAPVTFRDENEYQLHRILRAIDKNVVLSKLDHFCKSHEYMRPEQELKELYKQYPQIIQNTQYILDQCSFSFDFKTPKNKKHFTSSLEEDRLLLEKLAYEGLEKRYGTENAEASARLKKELQVIHALRFNSYFLITWDIVRFSNSQGFLHIGRGSGANSIVSYCLGITNICPIELDLYFERFLNLNRKSPPDFDIDWSWKERDIILDYIFKKYGKHHVAFCGTNVEFKYRSILREVGKVFGLPKEELDVLTNSPQSTHDQNSVVQQIHFYGSLLEKFPNQRSMHACGILISEEPLTTYSALEMPPKGFPIVQFDMHVAEEIGLEKFDILSQRGIGHINDSVKLIRENQGIEVDIRNPALSKDEAQANVYLSQGKTIGCFYIESPAMRGLLRRLKCDNYRTLVAASSIIRPGVAQSGMMREYIFRHNNPGQFEYFHPVFEEHLGETYGIMVYQEDVIRVALYYGGIAEADGDILRRAMSGKGRSLSALQRVKDNFLASCAKQGHPEDLSREVYRQIESFAGYSFCKAHSASYAVESYQSLYLKVYYPLEFMVAVINNQGGFYRTEVYIHEARMSGGNILNPCVNKSKVETSIYGKDIYLGFMHLQSLEARIMNEIVVERDRNGEYLDLEDFIKRVPVGLEALEILIFIGAFRFTGKSKNELLVQARLLLTKAIIRAPELIQAPSKEYTLPKLERSPFEDAFDEIELLGFPVSCSPFDLLKTKYRGSVLVKDLVHHHKKEVKMLAYLISRKHVPTKLGTMYFGTWIDVEGQYFDTAHFPNSLKQYPFQGGGCYLLKGIVEVDYHFPTVTITRMARLPFIPDPRYIHDKDREYKVHEQIREDISLTQRAPYPQAHEIGLPRWRLGS